jgi:hypothetical protein
MTFGQGESEDGKEVTREDQVRSAFNSPFRPFVLASTSVGQEGLDFHQYCHRVHHWNLPSNPVDLEQREGRIHRYKGHVVRKNLAKHYGLVSANGQDPWHALFVRASCERKSEENDLVPYWVFETDGGSKIERCICNLPLSRDVERLSDLIKSVAAYRVSFGQPRQEDLVEYLCRRQDGEKDHAACDGCTIDLSPPSLPTTTCSPELTND